MRELTWNRGFVVRFVVRFAVRLAVSWLLAFDVLSAQPVAPPAARSTARSAAVGRLGLHHPRRSVVPAAGTGSTRQTPAIPAGSTDASDRLVKSPRHHEYVKIATGSGSVDSVAAWVVYPQVRGNAPVVIVVHEIYGLTSWIRAVADQLAADGFIAIAPDLMTGKISPATPDSAPQLATQVIRTLSPATVHAQLRAVGAYGLSLPASKRGRYAVVGFCWGGSTAFAHAVANPELGAAVVFYGASPATADLARIKAPVLGLYGELDARVNVSIAPADSALRASGAKFDWQMYAGAGHGFLRNQDGMAGANLAASKLAWPRTVTFLRSTVGR